MTRPDTLFEAASYDLNKFIERRVAERRAMQRDSADRRKQSRQAQPPDNSFQGESSAPQQQPSH